MEKEALEEAGKMVRKEHNHLCDHKQTEIRCDQIARLILIIELLQDILY